MLTHSLKLLFVLAALTLSFNGISVSAQSEWVPADPTSVVPQQVAVFNCDGKATVFASWVFGASGYRVKLPHVVRAVVKRFHSTFTLKNGQGYAHSRLSLSVRISTLALLNRAPTHSSSNRGTQHLKKLQFTIVANPTITTLIDDRCFFVGQHYRDFLSRESDGYGLAFWTNDIASCGMAAQCLEVKRINVSAAFFLSIESRETGYYVYRIYRTALGRPPTFAEFVPDAAELGRNVVVGSAEPWRARLEDNILLYTLRFFFRADFQGRYNGLTNSQYVDKLFETQGLTPSSSERNQLINSLDNCTNTIGCAMRWSVLRKIVERQAFDRAVFNEAFVTMEYFGYLRRDPDPQGFQFWLDKLNRFNGNFIEAEMVKAFLNADEYRKRF